MIDQDSFPRVILYSFCSNRPLSESMRYTLQMYHSDQEPPHPWEANKQHPQI